MQRVEGKPGLVKDPETGGIINVDTDSFRAAREAKRRILEAKRKEHEMEDRMRNLENKLDLLIEYVVQQNGEANEQIQTKSEQS